MVRMGLYGNWGFISPSAWVVLRPYLKVGVEMLWSRLIRRNLVFNLRRGEEVRCLVQDFLSERHSEAFWVEIGYLVLSFVKGDLQALAEARLADDSDLGQPVSRPRLWHLDTVCPHDFSKEAVFRGESVDITRDRLSLVPKTKQLLFEGLYILLLALAVFAICKEETGQS